MDPSSIITQVKGPLEKQESTSFKDAHFLKQCKSQKTDSDSVIVDLDDAETRADTEQRTPPSGSGSFLSQLLCCFGLGHVPGHGGTDCQEQQLDQQLPPGSQDQELQLQLESQLLLPPVEPGMANRICAVIDLDETLVHSSFRCEGSPDFEIEVEVDGFLHKVYVLKRPFVDEFLAKVGELFECVLFTASMGKYADPVCDLIDPGGALKHRLFRESCVLHCQSYVKDLATLGRPLDRCLIIDNSPASYLFNPENAIQVDTWTGDPSDTELSDLLPYLENLASTENSSVPEFLRSHQPPLQESSPLTLEQVAAQMTTADTA